MKTIITALAFFIVATITAQEFSGKAIYKTSRKSNIKIGTENSTMSEQQTKEIEARLQKMNQKTFILNFDKTTSIYKEEEKLEGPKTKIGSNGINMISLGGSVSTAIYYKNIQQKRFANKTEIQGKAFLVKDKLKEYEWELSSETKKHRDLYMLQSYVYKRNREYNYEHCKWRNERS
ncbi:GLPGLI family protein [Polaribacter filamentus]|uniref:GLPGLI family protein n=1 Tax=Polaribacter filamentus TaxID=53483 RepID=UPI001F0BF8CD|nr:GLPGLI family protein [Polaribacter filamentus]